MDLMADVHGAFGRKPPDGSIVARAARNINRDLGFWQLLAPRFRTLAALYHHHR